MATVKNVLVAGATGNLGPAIIDALIKSGNFNITATKRVGSKSTIPASVKVVEVDYESLESLTAAFEGQDAVIYSLGFVPLEVQIRMVDAAIAAKVKRFLPGDFGSDLSNPKARALPVYGHKVAVQNYLEDKARTTPLTYTFVRNSAFLDWGLKVGFLFNLSEYKPTIYDGGDYLFSTTTTTTVGVAVAGVLNHYEETKNRAVYIQDTVLSQNKLLAIAKKLTPGKTWEPVYVNLAELKAASDARIAKGLSDMETLRSYLFVGIFRDGYGSRFQKLDNELLGIKEKTEEEIEALVKTYLPGN